MFVNAFAPGPEVTSSQIPLPGHVRDSVTDPVRRATLAALAVLDSEKDPDFDRLTKLGASMFHVPACLVGLIDQDRIWYKSTHGFGDTRELPVGATPCAVVLAESDGAAVVVPDALADPRFASYPLVTGGPQLRFYAAAPIMVRGQKLGTLSILSHEPRPQPDPGLASQLEDLAATVAALFELKDEARVRARTAAALVKEEWRHALTLEAGKVGSWVWDVRTGEIVVNDILRRMYGLEPVGPVTFDDVISRVVPEDAERVQAGLHASFEDGGDYEGEFRIGATGRWLIARGRVYQRDGAGKPLIMMGITIDVTDTKRAAEHTRMLLRELNHRVKNTLAMIQSLARQTVRRNPDPVRFIDAFSGRLRTLSEAHALLADRDWAGIGLLELIRLQVGPQLTPQGRQLEIAGEDLELPPDHALGLGLILHELASNAHRYGALSTPAGRVSLSWTMSAADGGRRVDLVWREHGGPAVAATPDLGFGGKLILRSLEKVIGSSVELDFPAEGAVARIGLPL